MTSLENLEVLLSTTHLQTKTIIFYQTGFFCYQLFAFLQQRYPTTFWISPLVPAKECNPRCQSTPQSLHITDSAAFLDKTTAIQLELRLRQDIAEATVPLGHRVRSTLGLNRFRK
jgi:hypothetical protein